MPDLDLTALKQFLLFALTDNQHETACMLLDQAIAEATAEPIGAEAIVEIEPDEKPLAPPPLLFPTGCTELPNALEMLHASQQPRQRPVVIGVLIATLSLIIGFGWGSHLRPTIEPPLALATNTPFHPSLSPDTPVCAPLMPLLQKLAPPERTAGVKKKRRKLVQSHDLGIPATLQQAAAATDRPDSLDRLIKKM